jgi:hypothetical protein
VDTSRFDACAKKSMEDLNRAIKANAKLLSMAHEMANQAPFAARRGCEGRTAA